MLINNRRFLRAQLGRLDNETLQNYVEGYLESRGIFEGIFGFFCPFADEEITRREYLIAREILEERQINYS